MWWNCIITVLWFWQLCANVQTYKPAADKMYVWHGSSCTQGKNHLWLKKFALTLKAAIFRPGTHEHWIYMRSTHVLSNGRWVSVHMSVALRAFASFEMHVIQVVCPFYLVLQIIKKGNRSRRWRVHPINSEQHIHDQFYTLYRSLREYSDKFFNYFRMSATSFNELVSHKELCNA
jgi:hypothetical protein